MNETPSNGETPKTGCITESGYSPIPPTIDRCAQLTLELLRQRFDDPEILAVVIDRLEKQLHSTRIKLLAESSEVQLETGLWHSLKGAAGCVGADDIMRHAAALETATTTGQWKTVRDGTGVIIHLIEDCLADLLHIRDQMEAS
jgi:hypothetical protein